MVEVVGAIVVHAEALHHTAGAPVRLRRERDDLREAERLKAVAEASPCAFRRIAVAPRVEREPVSKLHAGREGCLERRDRQGEEADEGGPANDFDGPRPEAVPGEMVARLLHLRGALLECDDAREELADTRVGVECSPRREIFIAPLSEL